MKWATNNPGLGNEHYSGLSSRAGCRGFSPATKRVATGYFYWKMEEKEPKEIPSRLIPRLPVVFTRQLEILVTTLTIMFLCLTILAFMTGNWLVSKYKNSYFAPPRGVEQKELH